MAHTQARRHRGLVNVCPASAEHENVASTFLAILPAIPEGKILSRLPALASIPLAGGKLTLRVGTRKWIEPS